MLTSSQTKREQGKRSNGTEIETTEADKTIGAVVKLCWLEGCYFADRPGASRQAAY